MNFLRLIISNVAKSKVSHSGHVLVEYINTARKSNVVGVGGGGRGSGERRKSRLVLLALYRYALIKLSERKKTKQNKTVCEPCFLRGGSLTTGDKP